MVEILLLFLPVNQAGWPDTEVQCFPKSRSKGEGGVVTYTSMIAIKIWLGGWEVQWMSNGRTMAPSI